MSTETWSKDGSAYRFTLAGIAEPSTPSTPTLVITYKCTCRWPRPHIGPVRGYPVAMRCDVCGHRMDADPGAPWVDHLGRPHVWWVCTWCLATALLVDGEPPGLPPYRPTQHRWCVAFDRSGLAHAFASSRALLCGLSVDGIDGEGYSWSQRLPKTCQRCVESADVVDGRWPVGKRGRQV